MVQTASLLGTQRIREGVWQCRPTVKDQVVCGTVDRDMHYKDLGSIVRCSKCIINLNYIILLKVA